MSSGLFSGTSGLGLGSGLYRLVSGLWSGASGLVSGFGAPAPPGSYYYELEDASGLYLMEDGVSYYIQEGAP